MKLEEYENKYGAINPLYSQVMGHLTGNIENFPKDVFDRFDGDAQRWSTQFYWSLKKAIATIERMNEINIDQHQNRSEIIDVLRNITYLLSKHFMVEFEGGTVHPYYPFKHCLDTFTSLESYLRNLCFGKNIVHSQLKAGQSEHLVIGGINVSERCCLGCDFCSIDAKSSDPEMPLSVIHNLLSSDQICLKDVHLGDGEVIIHSDPELPQLIKKLIREYGIRVSFTTAGLVPKNREAGIRFLEGLGGLEDYCDDLRITTSFNLINPAAKDNLNLYLECMAKTLTCIEQVKGPHYGAVRVQIVVPEDGQEAAADAFEKIKTDVFFAEYRKAVPSGRAKRNYKQGKRNHGINCRAKEEFTIRPNGDITNFCMNSGTRGSTLGNIYVNDREQTKNSYLQFLEKLRELKEKDPDEVPCESHRNSNILIRPPASPRPICKKKMKLQGAT